MFVANFNIGMDLRKNLRQLLSLSKNPQFLFFRSSNLIDFTRSEFFEFDFSESLAILPENCQILKVAKWKSFLLKSPRILVVSIGISFLLTCSLKLFESP